MLITAIKIAFKTIQWFSRFGQSYGQTDARQAPHLVSNAIKNDKSQTAKFHRRRNIKPFLLEYSGRGDFMYF